MDGVFGGAATAASAVAAVHLGSLVEHRGLFSARGARSALVTRGLRGLGGLGGMSLSCHDRPLGCGLDLGCEVKPASNASDTGSAA